MAKRGGRQPSKSNRLSASDFTLDTFSISEEDHPKLKAAMHEAAAAAIAEFPKTLELVKDQFLQYDPPSIMASFAAYGLMTTVGPRGTSEKKPLKDILQHHAELLQAIMLTIPSEHWGLAPVVPGVMQTMFETVPTLSDTFFLQRIAAARSVKDEQQLAVLSLQDRIRLHTHGVRNWGYFSEVVGTSRELYSALDTAFTAHHGFTCTNLIDVMDCVLAEFERRQNEHWETLRRVLRGRNAHQIFRLYFKYVPGLVGSAEQMIAGLPRINLEGAKSVVMAHFDLRLRDRATFTPDEVAKLSGHSADVVATILKAIAVAPGSLVDGKIEHLFLGNPIWERPVVDLGDSFFLPMPQVVFSHIHRIVERLAAAADLKVSLEKARSRYLQQKLEATLRRALPGANITSSAKWTLGDRQYETDVLVVLDRTVIAAEAKAHRLTPEGLRGAPERVKRHVEDMVLGPSIQSERFASLIAAARSGDAMAITTVKGLGIDPGSVDRTIRFSVTLDDLSVLSASEREFKQVGWVPPEHDLAPTILITDLICIVDILARPIPLLHYLGERTYFQKTFNLMGDELDFLGVYLATGFNLSVPEKDMLFAVTGMSGPIDRYYTSRDAGVSVTKPVPALSPLFNKIVDRLNERRPPGWTSVGLHLLNSANLAEQRDLERHLEKLRVSVQKNYRDPKHINSVQIQPAQKRKARVGFYLFPEDLRPNLKASMEQLAAQALNEVDTEACVLFARSTARWDWPYEAVLYVSKPGLGSLG